MERFELCQCVTADNLIHQGIFFGPEAPGKNALLFVHGLTSTFYSQAALFNIMASVFQKHGIAIASFNNRGHDMLAGMRRVDKNKAKGYAHDSIGAGREKFIDCVHDIDAGVRFLVSRGFREVVVMGHSTGANKTCYFAGMKKDPQVCGYILTSPMSDRLVPGVDPGVVRSRIRTMKRFMKEGKGEELVSGFHFFPITPKRYLSLYDRGSKEDVFDYGDPTPAMTVYRQIRKPLLVIFGGCDEAADRPVETIKAVFDAKTSSSAYKSVVIEGAFHSFEGKERSLAEEIALWVLAV